MHTPLWVLGWALQCHSWVPSQTRYESPKYQQSFHCYSYHTWSPMFIWCDHHIFAIYNETTFQASSFAEDVKRQCLWWCVQHLERQQIYMYQWHGLKTNGQLAATSVSKRLLRLCHWIQSFYQNDISTYSYTWMHDAWACCICVIKSHKHVWKTVSISQFLLVVTKKF